MQNGLKACALGCLCLLLAGCNFIQRDGAEAAITPEAEPQPEMAVPVEVTLPERGDIAEYLPTAMTNVAAEDQVEVTSKATAICTEVLVEEGDRVERGQVLAELEKDEAMASLRQAEVQLRQNRSQLEIAREGVEAGITAPVELDNARFTYEQSQASYEQQKLQVENLTIRAPIDGVVTHRMIQEGMLVSSGAPVFRIVDPSSYQLAIYPSEQDLLKLREGQVAEVSFDALPGQEFEARVERINPAIDPENQRVKVVLGLEEAVRQQLAEGGLARVRLVVDVREDALLVPKDAIIEESGREYVFTIEERPVDPENAPDDAALETGTQLVAKRLPVETGLEEGPRIEVKAGIEPDRPIVTLGREALREGSPVRITTSEEELEAAADVDFDEALEQAAKKRDEGAHTVPDRH